MSYVRTLSKVRFMERNMYAAAQAQEASTAFLTRMSHEMRTPINAILGMNKMILRESKEDNVLDYARDVNSAGNYLLSIVNEVLDLAKVNAGKIEIANEDYMLMDMVRECYSMVRPRAKASRLAFEVDMSDVLPSVLRGDRDRLIQVITNLLTNAVKYTPEGRIKLSIDGKISDGRLLLIIMVSDTGIGVEEENIPYLFDSFRRVGEFKNNKIEGTGLGLTITKQLVELMGGNIDVSSVYGKGTVFTVVVPQDIRSVEPCGTFSMGPNGDRRVADRNEIFDLIGRILVVDDVAINLRVFTMLLSNTDITVDTAISGAEALEKIKKQKYDIIWPHMGDGYMKEIALKESDVSRLKEYPLHGIISTESKIYYYKKDPDWQTQHLFKRLYLTDEKRVYRKERTIEELQRSELSTYPELVLPEEIVTIQGIKSGFTIKEITDCKNLHLFLNDKKIPPKDKIVVLKKIGELLRKVQSSNQEFYFGDLQEYNFLVNDDLDIFAVDLDSSAITRKKPLETKYIIIDRNTNFKRIRIKIIIRMKLIF